MNQLSFVSRVVSAPRPGRMTAQADGTADVVRHPGGARVLQPTRIVLPLAEFRRRLGLDGESEVPGPGPS